MANNATTEIGSLEKQTLLTNTPEGKRVLKELKKFNPTALYKVYLLFMINGNKVVGTKSTFTNCAGIDGSINVTDNHFRTFLCIANDPRWAIIKTQTPAGQSSAFEPAGSQGVTTVLNPQRLDNNPVTGAQKKSPSLVEYALNKIHPKFTEELENYCMLIKTRAYLALPAMAFGSVQQAVSFVNGVVSAFQGIIFSVYKGIIKLIQQFYAYINGVIQKIQNMLISLIEQIVPLELICMLLEAVSVILDDISFFGSLFGMSGSIFNFINTIQGYIGQASSIISNPFGYLTSFIPPDIQNVINMVNQVGSNPGAFLTQQLSNFGYANALNLLQGNIIQSIMSKYGSQYAAVGPLSQLATNPNLPTLPTIIFPNIFCDNGYNRDENKNLYPNPAVIDFTTLGLKV